MSINYYSHKWEECINQLLEQIEDEDVIGSLEKKSDIEWFQFYGTLYIKYIDIYRKLEDVHDQMVHPQKRQLLKEMLVNTMIRMCQVKQNVVKYNTHANAVRSQFVNFDELIMDLKLTPKCLEVPVPRFFRQDDRLKLNERNNLVRSLMEEYHETTEPEEEVVVQSMFLETNFQTAVRIIQKLERGRQGIVRTLEAFKFSKTLGLKRKFSIDEQESVEDKQNRMVMRLQKYWRAFSARMKFSNLRSKELEFLGIVRQEDISKIQKKALQNRQEQKKLQEANYNKMVEDRERIKSEIRMAEGGNMKIRFLDERRKWLNNYLVATEFRKLPNKVSQFYQEKNIPEKEDPKKTKGKSQSPEKAKKKTKAEPPKEEPNNQAFLGIIDNVNTYHKEWTAVPEPSEIPYDVNKLKEVVRPQIEQDVKNLVDSMISLQLDNMRIKFGIRKKKQKKKKAKKKKTKKVKIPLGLGKKDPRQLLAQLIELKIVKFLKPAHISDFKGQSNYLGTLQDRLSQSVTDPSYAQLRQVIIESIAIPLGSVTAKQRLNKLSWFLFYGPSGTGKTLVVRSIQTQCQCIVLDLSPDNLEGKFADKKELKRLVWMSIIIAKKYQPSIVLIEDVETILQPKKKKKGVVSNAKMKKAILEMRKNKLWDKLDRIAVVGCSIKPYNGEIKLFKKVFQKHYYFPYPNYATRKLLIEHLIATEIGKPLSQFPVSTLCQITQGFTAGSFLQAIKKVLTEHRKKRLSTDPLKLSQFLAPLSTTYCTYAEDYRKLQAFTEEVTGVKQRRQQNMKDKLVEATKKSPKKR